MKLFEGHKNTLKPVFCSFWLGKIGKTLPSITSTERITLMTGWYLGRGL